VAVSILTVVVESLYAADLRGRIWYMFLLFADHLCPEKI
jgi:hypothetical protein